MKIIAIDPGNQESAFVIYDCATRRLSRFAKVNNPELLASIQGGLVHGDHLVIEQIASYGMAVGAEVFETVFWSGRFAQAWESRGGAWSRLKRLTVKMALCKDSRAKDANIRQALIDLFGPSKEKAIGKKKTPGPLFGVSGDCWAALAVAVTFSGPGSEPMA